LHLPDARAARARGFTLIEIALALLIVGILAVSLMVPTGARLEAARRADTADALDTIREAILGFAMVHGRLPCPDYRNDPADASYGTENCIPVQAGTATEGFLPWKTLGVPETDAWGAHRSDASLPRRGDWHYRVERRYTQTSEVKNRVTATDPDTAFHEDKLKVFDHAGNRQTTLTEFAVAIVFSAGTNGQPDGRNATVDAEYETDTPRTDFDDQVIWLGRPLLAARLYAAGKLP
jgi:prepilin-type N-terminal cleavage/methylation domain-containing protein